MRLGAVLVVLVFSGAQALVAPPSSRPGTARSTTLAASTNPYESISKTLTIVEEKQLLSKVAKLGLLTKLEKAGLTLRDCGPLLVFAEENGLVGAIGELNDDLLPLLPTVVGAAPLALPLVGAAISLPAALFFALAAASVGGAFAVTALPDDSVTSVALQTFLAIPLATLFPILFGGLGVVSAKLN